MNLKKSLPTNRFVFYVSVMVLVFTALTVVQVPFSYLATFGDTSMVAVTMTISGVMLLGSLIVPILCSMFYMRRSSGSIGRRFILAMLLPALAYPLMRLMVLPGDLSEAARNPKYWEYDTYGVEQMLIVFEVVISLFFSLLLNGTFVIAEKWRMKNKIVRP